MEILPALRPATTLAAISISYEPADLLKPARAAQRKARKLLARRDFFLRKKKMEKENSLTFFMVK